MRAGAEPLPNILSQLSDSGVLTLTIDREEKRNALNRDTLHELEAGLCEGGADPRVKVIVLRGAGEHAFSAGADLAELRAHETIEAYRQHFDLVARVILAMHRAGPPVLARVQGFALAGGCGLAVAADFTIAAESAVFGLPEIGIGLLPMVVSAPIYRATGSRKVVLDLMLTGRRVAAREALALGLATRVVPDAALDAELDSLVRTLCGYSPTALRLGKEAVHTMCEMEYATSLRYLREMIVLTSLTDDAKEGLNAFFEKRPPAWKGR
jgi:enoyl-CoA hydratase